MRVDGRTDYEIREIRIETGYQPSPEGSALIQWGETRVLCSATVENRVPPFITTRGSGWVTAEYDMIPGSGNRRIRRDRGGAVKGRSQEIQRLIGRSLRQSVRLDRLGDRTMTVDCDVLVADGGTRVAAVTGGAVAVRLALKRLVERGDLESDPWLGFVAAVSMGVVDGRPLMDLCYEEDSRASMDMNLVCMSTGMLVELQASAEQTPCALDEITSMTAAGIRAILECVVPAQKLAAGD
jgi:ribonuclease PH